MAHLYVLVFLAFVVALCSSQPGFPGYGDFAGFDVVYPVTLNTIIDIDASFYDHDDFITALGVSKECLVIMDNWAWQVQQNGFMSRCPKQQFGALAVNFQDHSGSVVDSKGRSCGRILATNRGVKTLTDVTEHSEIDALRRLAYHNMGQRTNASLWAPLAVFTPGASCPMDTAAEVWAGISWQLYSLSIADLIALNFTQIAMEPEDIMIRRATIKTQKLGLVRYVNRRANVGRFGYRNILANPCPTGCQRVTPTSACTDIEPYVFEPSMLIPDVNYYQAPEDFELLPRTAPLI